MTALTLTLREAPARDIDLSGLTPDRLNGLDRAGIDAFELPGGQRVDKLFDVAGSGTQQLVIRNPGDRLTHIGAGMRAGTITVEGDCGAYAGQSMRGGKLIVTGSAGNFLGAAPAGDRQGMRGGIIAIYGNAGDRAGERMRRGLILVGGNAGAYCAANMLAGTIFVAGDLGTMPGFSLRRGTLLLRRKPQGIPATFGDSGEYSPLFLTLMEKQLQREGAALARFLPFARKVRRYCGDLACGGAGEMLVFA
jgi:formylmethanofuran dehydrogenase subunit C